MPRMMLPSPFEMNFPPMMTRPLLTLGVLQVMLLRTPLKTARSWWVLTPLALKPMWHVHLVTVLTLLLANLRAMLLALKRVPHRPIRDRPGLARTWWKLLIARDRSLMWTGKWFRSLGTRLSGPEMRKVLVVTKRTRLAPIGLHPAPIAVFLMTGRTLCRMFLWEMLGLPVRFPLVTPLNLLTKMTFDLLAVLTVPLMTTLTLRYPLNLLLPKTLWVPVMATPPPPPPPGTTSFSTLRKPPASLLAEPFARTFRKFRPRLVILILTLWLLTPRV